MELINRRERLFTPNINDTLQVSRPSNYLFLMISLSLNFTKYST